jgi:hypothetical protein
MSEEKDYPKGGEQGYEGDGPNLRYDDFVRRIVQDPNEPPGVTLLSGYLGSSSEEGHVRLYLDEELCRYVEIPEKAIRHTQELSPEQSPLGGSLVWIDRGAEVLHGAAGSERRKATFLEGQIAQDYIGGAGGIGTSGGGGITTQTRECGGGVGILPTDMGPGCGQSHFGPCIPPTELLGCHTLTGIFCTRFGPGCHRRTVFEPACTLFGPNCHTVLVQQCHSVYSPCVTQNEPRCVASGFVGCNPPIDFTIFEQPGAQQQFAGGGGAEAFAGGQNFGGAQGFAAFPPPTNFCPPTRTTSCQSRLIVACLTRFPNECQLMTAFNCVSRVIRCPTIAEPRCRISQIAVCDETRICEVASVACGVDPLGGGGVQQRIGVGGGGFDPTIGVFQTGFNCPSVFDNCATRESFCPTQDVTCPSRFVACQSQFNDCITRSGCVSSFIRCPTADFNCPSVAIRCPTRGEPRCFASRTFICPDTRAGCQFDTAVCGVDPGGGGVINPAAGGGGAQAFRAEGFAAQPQPGAVGAIPQTRICPSAIDACPTRFNCPSQFTPCQSQLIRCQSQLDACPTRFNCPTLPNGCPGYTQFGSCPTVGACPSAVDACPTRFGCFETQVCGGGFDPGGFGGGGFGGGF